MYLYHLNNFGLLLNFRSQCFALSVFCGVPKITNISLTYQIITYPIVGQAILFFMKVQHSKSTYKQCAISV